MDNQSTSNGIIRVYRGELQSDGLHSGVQFTYALRMGRMLRVRHGCYVAAETWLSAPPWVRYDIALVAAGLSDQTPIFCRQAALRLHGIPLLSTPATVTARTAQHGRAGVRHTGPMSGTVPIEKFVEKYRARFAEPQSLDLQDFENIPSQRIEPALPYGVSRSALREQMRGGNYRQPQVELPAEALDPVRGVSGHYLAEPLELALVDTVPRLPFLDAVVILDAARNRQLQDFRQWLPQLRSKRLRQNWERAWEFADARAESPLESASRGLVHQLGFRTPTPQVVISTDEGRFRVDLAWLDDGVVAEIDGREKYYDDAMLNGHDPRDIAYREKQRRDALDRHGWKVVRWWYAEMRTPELISRRLAEAGVSPRV